MIDTEKKKYIAELCASVYGTYPRDVVPFQVELPLNGKKEGVFYIDNHISGSQLYVVFGVKGNTVDSRVFVGGSGGAFDFRTGFICDTIEVSGSTSGTNVSCITGYQCVW